MNGSIHRSCQRCGSFRKKYTKVSRGAKPIYTFITWNLFTISLKFSFIVSFFLICCNLVSTDRKCECVHSCFVCDFVWKGRRRGSHPIQKLEQQQNMTGCRKWMARQSYVLPNVSTLLSSPICEEGDEGKGIEFLQVSIKDKVQTIFSPPQGTFVSHHNWEVLSCKGNEILVLIPWYAHSCQNVCDNSCIFHPTQHICNTWSKERMRNQQLDSVWPDMPLWLAFALLLFNISICMWGCEEWVRRPLRYFVVSRQMASPSSPHHQPTLPCYIFLGSGTKLRG